MPRITRSCRSAWCRRARRKKPSAPSPWRARKKSPCCRAAAAPRRPGRPSNSSLVIDCSKYLTRILDLDVKHARCTVEPGIVLDDLNRRSSRTACGFRSTSRPLRAPPSAAWRPTIPAARRSMRFGTMRDNVISIEALLADGALAHFGRVGADLSQVPPKSALRPLAENLLGDRRARRRTRSRRNSQRCSAGSAATISTRWCRGRTTSTWRTFWSVARARWHSQTRIELKLWPLLGRRAVGAVPFRQLLRGDGRRAAHRAAGADRRRTDRPHHDRAGARDRDVPSDAGQIRARDAGGDPAGRIRRGRP